MDNCFLKPIIGPKKGGSGAAKGKRQKKSNIGKKKKKIRFALLIRGAVAGITVVDESRFLWRSGDFYDFDGFNGNPTKPFHP